MADYDILLRDHVSLTCRSIDRIFLQGYVPQLQSVGQVCRFLVGRGYRIPSSAAFGQIGDTSSPSSIPELLSPQMTTQIGDHPCRVS